MKEKYNNYFRWGMTIFTIIICSILFFFFIFRMNTILEFISKILDILTPITLGAVIAYLINPLVTITDKYLFSLCKRCHVPAKVSGFIAMAVSITLWLGLLIAGISLLFSMIVPELYSSILKLAGDFRGYVTVITDFVNEHLNNKLVVYPIVNGIGDGIQYFFYIP